MLKELRKRMNCVFGDVLKAGSSRCSRPVGRPSIITQVDKTMEGDFVVVELTLLPFSLNVLVQARMRVWPR